MEKEKANAKREHHPIQTERLSEYLIANGEITPLDAWSKLGIYRLSGRIFDLKEQGWGIESTRTTVRNAFGEKCSVALYRLTFVPETSDT